MELSLRKARKLESKINNHVQNLKTNIVTHMSVRVNADIQTEVLPQLVKARNEFLSSLENIQNLIDARFTVRGLIARQNELSGINAKILEKVTLENKISILNGLIRDISTLDEKELEDDSQKFKICLEKGDRWGQTSFEAQFLLMKDESEFKKNQVELSKQIESLEDTLLELNYSTKVNLNKELVTLLQANGLL